MTPKYINTMTTFSSPMNAPSGLDDIPMFHMTGPECIAEDYLKVSDFTFTLDVPKSLDYDTMTAKLTYTLHNKSFTVPVRIARVSTDDKNASLSVKILKVALDLSKACALPADLSSLCTQFQIWKNGRLLCLSSEVSTQVR